MNLLTFDTEEWALAEAGGYGSEALFAEYDCYLNKILEILDQNHYSATFFCTGMMASSFPEIVKRIHYSGHEIGCHSHRHTWMNKMSRSEAKNDTHIAIDSLEQCIGQKIISYRAPSFTIGEGNKWMFEILAEEGIERDSSVFPTLRDFGGFLGFPSQKPCSIEYAGVRIKEFPINLTTVLGRQVVFSGGGYFRFFPLSFVRSRIAKSYYSMCYFHINDLIPETGSIPSRSEYELYYKEPGTIKNRYIRYLKSNFGKKGAWFKLSELINSNQFMNLEHADQEIDWSLAPVINL